MNNNSIDIEDIEELRSQAFSFNLRMAIPNIDRSILELQWNLFYPELTRVLDFIEEIFSREFDMVSQEESLSVSSISPPPSPTPPVG